MSASRQKLFFVLSSHKIIVMARIQVIQPEEATGELKEIYENLTRSRGKLAEVHKIQSLNPQSIVSHMELYMTIMFGKSPLKRVQREMLGVVVSRQNGCCYCQKHHLEAVIHYWKDEAKAESFRKNFRNIDLQESEEVLCEYAEKLTLHPGEATETDYTAPLREVGWSDRAILDATLVISYFNFVNRIVMGLSVDTENNTGGYNY
jgi:uncharacterized peroxidase-related enzyme